MGMIKAIRNIFNLPPKNQNQTNEDEGSKIPLKTDLEENIKTVKASLGHSPDIVIREIQIGKKGNIPAAVIFTDGLADTKSVNHLIIESLVTDIRITELDPEISSQTNTFDKLKKFALAVGDIKDSTDFETLFTSVLSGDTALLVDGFAQGLIIGLKGWEDRGVQESTSQNVIRGPKEGFSENIRTNTALIRRKINDPNLWLENQQIGRITKTNVSFMYIKGIASEKVIEEVRERLGRIDIDGILESGYIEELIQDEKFTVFPTVFNSERPDVIAAGLLEGRIAILVDGTPFVLLVPAIFTQFFQSAEDYYQRADIASLVRILRYLSFFIALLAPSLYIAITTFHHDLLPPQLLFSLAAQHEGVPFPALIEALIMEITFEILREAGIRMPRSVGQAVSIVGALVIGQAAVEAGIVSAVMVIVVAITAIASFVLPAYNMGNSVRILRFGLMFMAASFGLFGIMLGLIGIVQHLCQLRSFGIPFMASFAPSIPSDKKDGLIRLPRWEMFSRPRFLSQRNIIREDYPPIRGSKHNGKK
ncbi:spore germination protein KA [Bacillus sp. V2I10]|nr:spore germination protein KA [Bacillus sp. V2I10]